jgi:hypothetical protein
MKTTIDMAREAEVSLREYYDETGSTLDVLRRFEALIRADEAEQIAKMCETHIVWVGRGKRGLSELQPEELGNGSTHQGMDYAAAIRARGGAK